MRLLRSDEIRFHRFPQPAQLSRGLARGGKEAVKHRQIRVNLAGNAQGRAILAQFKVVENVERCPGVKNLAAPASKNEVDDAVEGADSLRLWGGGEVQ